MRQLNLTQGSDEWKAVRGKYLTASEASMIMDCHAQVSRAELLRMKATGTEQEFSQWFSERVLENGHRVEALARPIIEARIGEELFPVVGVDDTDTYLASFDGITLVGDTVWECKQWNQEKAADVKNQRVPICDYWQVVHQLMVSGADKGIYTVTDGTPENTISAEVLPKPSDFRQLMAAWDQFNEDLQNYQHKPVIEKVQGKAQIDLPALVVEITGSVSNSNLPAFQSQALAMIQAIKTDLVTDEDFANAEQTVKALDAGEKELDSVKAKALAQTASIDELFKTIDSLKGEMRDKRLLLNKLVKSEKEARRFEQIQRGQSGLKEHIDTLNEFFTGRVKLPDMAGDFAGAIKGKKTMQSIHDAIDSELARCKVEANQQAELLRQNIGVLNELASNHKFLFADASEILFKQRDDLIALIKSRISDHEKAEQARLEAERERIRQEEERKAQEQAKAEAKLHIEEKSPQKTQTSAPIRTETINPVQTEETVTITQSEYNALIHDREMLNALLSSGVDNWDGYSLAMETLSNAA